MGARATDGRRRSFCATERGSARGGTGGNEGHSLTRSFSATSDGLPGSAFDAPHMDKAQGAPVSLDLDKYKFCNNMSYSGDLFLVLCTTVSSEAWAKLREWAVLAGKGRLLLSGSVVLASLKAPVN